VDEPEDIEIIWIFRSGEDGQWAYRDLGLLIRADVFQS